MFFSIFGFNSNIEIVFLLRIVKMRNLLKKMEVHLHLEDFYGLIILSFNFLFLEGCFNLMKLLFVILYVAHICACI